MDFSLSDERRMLKETAERYLRERYPLSRRHAAAASPLGFDAEAWADFAELGLIGALIEPECGGYGGTGEDIALVFEALGGALAVEPALASGVLGATPLARLGDDGQRALLGEAVEGRARLALAHGEPESRYAAAEARTSATQGADGGWRLSGVKAVAFGAEGATRIVVSARVSGEAAEEDGLGLFLLDPAAAGVALRPYPTIDGLRAAEIALEDAPAEPLGAPGAAFPVIEETLARGALALAAEAVGIMDVCLRLTLEHLRARTQFGRPIGDFQALQHRAVEMSLEIEQARSATMLAASALGAGRRERERTVAAAKHLAGRVGRLIAEETIQLHGGIAMTWDHPAPHYAKRLVMIDHQLGDQDHHLERFLALSRG